MKNNENTELNSNLKACKACGNEISKKAKKCPKCGEDQRNFFMRHKFITGIIVLVVLSAIFGGGGSKNNSEVPVSKGKTEETSKGNNDEEVRVDFGIDEIISYKDFDLVFENLRTINGLTGEEYLVLDATITSKTDNLKFFGDIQGVNSENEIIDDTIVFTDKDLGDPIMTAWTKTLNEGQKAKGYVAFDKPIDHIELRSNLFSTKVIKILLD